MKQNYLKQQEKKKEKERRKRKNAVMKTPPYDKMKYFELKYL